VKQQDKSLHEDITENVAAGMEADGGKLSKADKEKLRRIVDEDKLEIELREAA
jgi:DNA replication protein DnaD